MEGLHLVETRSLNAQHKLALFDLWNTEYPVNLAYKNGNDFESYLQNLGGQKHILLLDETENLAGWAFAFEHDRERWFALLLSARVQGKGLGKRLLQELQASEVELNGWVVDQSMYRKRGGDIYRSPLRFYQKMGFDILKDDRLELAHLSAVKIRWAVETHGTTEGKRAGRRLGGR